MIYKYIDGVPVSSIILGTDYYSCNALGEKACFKLYDMFTEFGGNHIDTARLYEQGESEQILGRWLKNQVRDKVYIATKGAHPPLGNMNFSRLTRKEIRKDLEASLSALSLDYIDLYWLHRDNKAADAGEVIEIMNELVKEGKIRTFGCSNWKGKRIKEANDYAKAHKLKGFSASQIKWSLAKTSDSYTDDPTLVEMNGCEYEFYKTEEIPVAAFASQGKGFFSKLYNGGVEALSEKAKDRYLCEENLKRFERIKILAEKYNTSVGAIVVSWIASNNDLMAMPIIGSKTEAQLSDSLKAAQITLTPEEIQYCISC